MKLIQTLYLFGVVFIYQYSYTQVLDPSIDTSLIWFGSDVSDPEFIGGFNALNSYLSANLFSLKRNEIDEKDKLNPFPKGARVIVRFIVETDGTVSDAILESKLPQCEPCNREAIRVVMTMPKWIPLSNGGKTERAFVRLPIHFEF
jgi:protein TonB